MLVFNEPWPFEIRAPVSYSRLSPRRCKACNLYPGQPPHPLPLPLPLPLPHQKKQTQTQTQIRTKKPPKNSKITTKRKMMVMKMLIIIINTLKHNLIRKEPLQHPLPQQQLIIITIHPLLVPPNLPVVFSVTIKIIAAAVVLI